MRIDNHEAWQNIAKKIQACNSNGVQFNVPIHEVEEMFSCDYCAYTGHQFAQDWKSPRGRSYERINPFIGYESGNVVLVTREANQEKSGLDAFVKGKVIPWKMKVKLLRKAIYALEKLYG